MPRYEWRGSDVFRDHRNDRVIEPGETVDIADAVADPQPQFVAVDEDSEKATVADDEDAEVSTGEDSEEVDTTESAEADFDADAWLDQDYTTREEAVLEGEVDEHLGKILEVETSETVKDAVDPRRED
jgi:hypothetical protein